MAQDRSERRSQRALRFIHGNINLIINTEPDGLLGVQGISHTGLPGRVVRSPQDGLALAHSYDQRLGLREQSMETSVVITFQHTSLQESSSAHDADSHYQQNAH